MRVEAALCGTAKFQWRVGICDGPTFRGEDNMRFRKALLLFSLLMVCSMLAAETAKADTIVFHDLTDTVTVDGSSRLAPVSPAVVMCVGELCTVRLNAPTGYTFSSTTLPLLYRIAESAGGTVSDRLLHPVFVVGSSFVQFTFDSDVFEPGVVPCTTPGGVGTCDVVENGLLQLAGTITWSKTGSPNIIDSVGFESDVVPEPASLILFGSGLAIAGAFLRRRRHA